MSSCFRTGVYVADNYDHTYLQDRLDPGVQTTYNVTGKLQSQTEVFKSDFAFFVAAAVIEQSYHTLSLINILGVLETWSLCLVQSAGGCKGAYSLSRLACSLLTLRLGFRGNSTFRSAFQLKW